MKRRQILISVETMVVVAILVGIGAYLYFVSPEISLNSLPFLSQPTTITNLPASPTPVHADLLSKPADKVGIVSKTEGNIIHLTDKDGEEFQITLNDSATLYKILPDVITDPPTTQKITLEDLDLEDALSIYLNDDQTIQAIFVLKK